MNRLLVGLLLFAALSSCAFGALRYTNNFDGQWRGELSGWTADSGAGMSIAISFPRNSAHGKDVATAATALGDPRIAYADLTASPLDTSDGTHLNCDRANRMAAADGLASLGASPRIFH